MHSLSRVTTTPLLRLTSRKPLWLELQPVDIKSRRRHNWKSAQVVNSHLVCDPTIRQPGFDLPMQQWSLLNRFRTKQGHCGACRRKWQLTSSSSRMRVINHNWSATKQRLHPRSVAEISRHSVLSRDRIRQCETSSGSRHKDTDQYL